MPTGLIRSSLNIGGISMSGEITRTVEGQIGHTVTLAHGSDGKQKTFTGPNEIIVTMETGNLVEAADVVDVYWYVAGVLYVKYGCTAALATLDVTVTGGAGDDYVTGEGSLEMVITKQQSINTDFTGDEIEIIAAVSSKVSHIEFDETAASSVAGIKLLANEPWAWVKHLPADDAFGAYINPLAGEVVDTIEASTGDHENDATLQIGILYDSA